MDHPPSGNVASPNSIVDDQSSSSSNCGHPMKLIHSCSNSPEGYFANLARYTEADNTAKHSDDLRCLVCGDRSNGKHYGIFACNGCSGFFKRTVRRKLIYHCQQNFTVCLIDKIHRNQCQSCRYKKCLQMGMIKEAVQNQRPSRMKIPSSEQIENTLNIFSTSKQTKDHQLVNHLDDSILLIIIEWIRHLPIFIHLSIHDQHVLLEETWPDLFLLSALSINNEHIFVNHGETMENIWWNFHHLKIDPIELICLKAIVLFRFDLRRLQDNQMVENFQDQAQITLAKYIQLSHHPTRFGRLLIYLSSLRAISVRWIEQTFFSSRLISKDLVNMFSQTKK